MYKLLSYSGIITKTKAMEGKFISYNNYQSIANLESVPDFISFLKNHPGYGSIFKDADENRMHRGQAEGLFIYGLYSDFSKLYRFSNKEQRYVLDLIYMRYEINALKACIHFISNQETRDLSLFTSFFKKHSKVNLKALAEARSMEEYINHLKGTEYHSLLTNIQKSEITTFDYEMKFDVHYFMKVWKLKDKLLKGDNLEAVTSSFGTEIDLLNIIWLFRSKKFYNLQTGDSYSYIIPVTYKLPKEKLVKLMEAVTLEEFINVLKNTHYEKLCTPLTEGTIESAYEKILFRIYQKNKNQYPDSMAPIIYYLHYKQLEISHLTTVLECIRYKLDPQDILKFVL